METLLTLSILFWFLFAVAEGGPHEGVGRAGRLKLG
jgi:hypothetical protein